MAVTRTPEKQIEALIGTRQFGRASRRIKGLDPGAERSRLCALAHLKRAESARDETTRLSEAKESYKCVLNSLYEVEDHERRRGLVQLLKEAAEIVDPDLAHVLVDPNVKLPTHGPTAHKVLKTFYLGGALPNLGSVGERALRKKQELEEATRQGRTSSGGWYIHFLKTYSSFSPLLPRNWRRNQGGGYFLALGGHGCIVDPGHHFLENFFSAGYVVDDIDSLAVTHHHDDHFADLEALLSLLHQHHRRRGKKVKLFLDAATREKFHLLIRESSAVKSLVLLDGEVTRYRKLCNGVRIRALPTEHDVHGENSGVGLCFNLQAKGTRLVITGDTAWNEKIARCYRGLRHDRRILVAHVSTVWPQELVSALAEQGPLYYDKHLAIHGLCKAIEALEPSKVVLSEIGEELDVARSGVDRLCRIISDCYGVECLAGMRGRSGCRVRLS